MERLVAPITLASMLVGLFGLVLLANQYFLTSAGIPGKELMSSMTKTNNPNSTSGTIMITVTIMAYEQPSE